MRSRYDPPTFLASEKYHFTSNSVAPRMREIKCSEIPNWERQSHQYSVLRRNWCPESASVRGSRPFAKGPKGWAPAAGVGWVLRGAATGTSKSRAADRACVTKVEGSVRSAPRFSLTRFSLTRFSLTRFSLTRFSLTRFSLTRFSLTRFSLAELRSADSRGRCPHGFIFLVCAIPVLGQVFFGTAGLRCFWLDIVSFWKNLAQN